MNEIKYPLLFVQDYCDLRSQPFVKVRFGVVDEPQAPKNALTWHYAFIFAYCDLKGVSFQRNISLKWVNGIDVINGNLKVDLYSKHIFEK